MIEILNSDAVLNIVGVIVAAIFAWIESTKFMADAKNERYAKALSAVEAGVDGAYEDYVKAIKEDRPGDKLTKEEIAEARRQAIDLATGYARREGVDLIKELGGNFLESILTRKVQDAKKLSTK
jgi:hypothetical protein